MYADPAICKNGSETQRALSARARVCTATDTNRMSSSNLGIAQRRQDTRNKVERERDGDGRSGSLGRSDAREHKDAGTDDAPNADADQIHPRQRALQLLVLAKVDLLAAQPLRKVLAHTVHGERAEQPHARERTPNEQRATSNEQRATKRMKEEANEISPSRSQRPGFAFVDHKPQLQSIAELELWLFVL